VNITRFKKILVRKLLPSGSHPTRRAAGYCGGKVDELRTHPIFSGERAVPRIIKSPYLIGGIIVFLILFGVLLFGVQATPGESLFASAALAVIGVVVLLWK